MLLDDDVMIIVPPFWLMISVVIIIFNHIMLIMAIIHPVYGWMSSKKAWKNMPTKIWKSTDAMDDMIDMVVAFTFSSIFPPSWRNVVLSWL